MLQPVIGITANYSFDGSGEYAEGIGAKEQDWQLIADDYIDCVARAGAVPLMLPVLREDRDQILTRRMLDLVDGVLFSGGSDVDPMRYGQKSAGRTGPVVPERDEQETFMLDYLLNRTKKPILGICRGIQIINAALGGTLIQHIPAAGFTSHTLSMYPRQVPSHYVAIEKDSLLFQLVHTERLPVNSLHHMAVDVPSPDLRVVARSEDGVIEGVELKNNPEGRFFLAVQWHPEMMAFADPVQQGLIDAFVDRCRK